MMNRELDLYKTCDIVANIDRQIECISKAKHTFLGDPICPHHVQMQMICSAVVCHSRESCVSYLFVLVCLYLSFSLSVRLSLSLSVFSCFSITLSL